MSRSDGGQPVPPEGEGQAYVATNGNYSWEGGIIIIQQYFTGN